MIFPADRRRQPNAVKGAIRRTLTAWAAGALLVLGAGRTEAEVKLDGLFSDGAVLQQGGVVPIFGTADEGDRVVVRLQGQEVAGVVKDGHWRAEFQPLEPGGPFQMEVSGSQSLTVPHIYVGEVWVCTGQSNMQWNVFNSKGSSAAVISSANRELHFYTVAREPADEPRRENSATWSAAAGASVANFSGVGYYFGREIQKQYQVPVGLISCTHYLSTTEAWVSRETLEADPALKTIVDDTLPDRKDVQTPGALYQGMVLPISQFSIRGVVCYEGENDLDQAAIYDKLFGAQIADWRKAWNRPDMPFVFVQIAPARPTSSFRSENSCAVLRESQTKAWRQTPNTGMVVITDHGDAYTLNPTEKEPVGKRLALAARAVAYGEKVEYAGPVYKKHTVGKGQITVEFDHTGGGLEFKGKKPLGFSVAGKDGAFVPADAEIKDGKVIVTAKTVEAPQNVRYAWADAPICNLFSKEGLPACPFRSDVVTTETPQK